MEVIGVHFDPPEPLKKKPDGTTETLSDSTMRRVFQGFAREDRMPAHMNFLQDGTYDLALSGKRPIKSAQLIIENDQARVEMQKVTAVHADIPHVIVDRNGNELALRSGAILIAEPREKEITGVGIGRRGTEGFAVEWYIFRVGRR